MGASAPGDRALSGAGGDAASLAASLGATDVLFFRRLGPRQWFHTSGVGRPSGWAGGLQVEQSPPGPAARTSPASPLGSAEPSPEPLVEQALRSAAGVRVLSATPVPIAGPYWASTAVLLRLSSDLLVVWGHPARSAALLAATDSALREASRRLVDTLDSVDATARRLGDELQVLSAVQALTGSLDRPLPDVLDRIGAVLAESLSAPLTAAWVGDGRHAVHRPDGLHGAAGDAALAAAAAAAAPPPGAPALVADASRSAPLPPPLSPADGVVSHLLLALDVPGGGGLLAARTTDDPHAGIGFSSLDRRIAAQVALTAAPLLQVAMAREEAEAQLHETRLQLGRDALTDVGSRHRWDEELQAAQTLVDSGVAVTVAMLDLDDLKWVNDTHGHRAGDELLRTCASALRGCLRGSSDVVARVGGDEFAVLVPRASDIGGLTQRLRSGVEEARTPSGLPLRVSVGAARCLPGQRVEDAIAEADALMYADKRRRRSEQAPA
jgi:diguanylate cyclase (GGDEF)-like protein